MSEGIDPRGDLSSVDPLEVNRHIEGICTILAGAEDEYRAAEDLRRYVRLYLNPFPEVYIAVNDELAKRQILSKRQLKDYLSLVLEI